MERFFIIKDLIDETEQQSLIRSFVKKLTSFCPFINEIYISDLNKIKKIFLNETSDLSINFIIPINTIEKFAIYGEILLYKIDLQPIKTKTTLFILPEFEIETAQLTNYYFDALINSSISTEEINEYISTLRINKKYIQKAISNKWNGFLNDTSLTEQERKVFELIQKGKQNKEIADMLFISPNTVKNHKANLIGLTQKT